MEWIIAKQIGRETIYQTVHRQIDLFETGL